ncbi:MAG TPA: PilC/PilY family type IV pilus protein [Variovorax sp.]|nr:PilC/PilY family type IV pilus protein [Variovorax sp.]
MTTHLLRRLPRRAWAWAALPVAALVLFLSFGAVGQSTAPAFKAVALASDPLYATTTGDKPAMALSLSVEYPTVGAQYTTGTDTDSTYSNTTEYLGYYDANSCYTYNASPTETPAIGLTVSDYRRFDRIGATTSTAVRSCSNAFSGNFLNWASSSAIDMLRLALSGGDRYIDTTDLTILQRAVLPNGNPTCMWNSSSNFPAKQLTRNGGGAGTYWGAVPNAMITAAGTNDIWVANTLDRIYFGTSRTGSCTDTSAYTLSTSAPALGPINTRLLTLLPSDATLCAGEGGTCSFSGVREVWYGAISSWKVAPASNGTACTNAVFGDPISGIVKNCYVRTYSGTWQPPASATALNPDGFFYARVQVCNKSGTALADNRNYPNAFCTRYPSGNFKPTGVIQRYSDQLRLAAFGYLLDQTRSPDGGRYGGVLRAPMKYVGGKTFDVYGQDNTPATGNPNAEWSTDTGVFATNPDANGRGISGVINYLNKFGRTGTKGLYKIYDPVSELYYETLRYMQGLQPSPAAVSNITEAMYDGFPVFTDWTGLDPYAAPRSKDSDYSCLRSNVVVVGDINTHDNINAFPAANAAANIPDRAAWTSVVQSFENGGTRSYVDGQGVARTTSNPSGYIDSSPRGDAIIGYSYWGHTQDIRGKAWTANEALQRPGLRVKTFLFDVNEYGTGSDPNQRRYNNQFFTAAKYGGFESISNASQAFNTYGNPFRRMDGTADNNVWQNTFSPGEAGSYFLQSDARGVLAAFESIFSNAVTRASNIAGAALAGSSTAQGNVVYQGSFDTSDWSGDLKALPTAVDSSGNASVSSTPTWSAAVQLAAQILSNTGRNIVVGNAGATATATATPFTWDAISADLKTQLGKPTSTTTDGLANYRLNYLRGTTTREGTVFRSRNNKFLGDIINSGVAYSGPPPATITSTTYAGFRADNLARAPVVFVGANDGMLHAFNAATGNEVFAYIPSWMGPKLAALTSLTYNTAHQSYVDGTPVVAQAEVGTANTKADWRTVLVSGTGAGGRGVFALDVTQPGSFDASKVMWEFTQNDDRDMGFVVGRPQILKLRTSAANATTATYKWFAVVASGVNNYVSQAGVFSATGQPSLFLLDLAKPASTAWTLNSNYYKIQFPVNTALAATSAPGMINFEAVNGAQGQVTLIYAGDLHGNMWKLDFRPWGTADWTLAKLSAFASGATPVPLFVARDANNNVQPISMMPSIVSAVRGSAASYVAFGTGKFIESDDRVSVQQQTFYAIYDNATTTLDTTSGTAAVSGRARLAKGVYTTAGYKSDITTTAGDNTIEAPAFVAGRATSDNDATQRSGWYFDYPSTGERQISSAQLRGDVLVVPSLIPGSAGVAAVCGVSGGGGSSYFFNIDTGDANVFISKVGILGPSIVLSLPAKDQDTTISNSTGRRFRTSTNSVMSVGDKGTGAPVSITNVFAAGRLSWRQINNYQDLKGSTP